MTGKTVWLDLISPSHPFLFSGLLDGLSDTTFRTTVRRKAETVDLAREAGFDFATLGRDFENVALRTCSDSVAYRGGTLLRTSL